MYERALNFFQKQPRSKTLKDLAKLGFLLKTELRKHVFTEVVPLIPYNNVYYDIGKRIFLVLVRLDYSLFF